MNLAVSKLGSHQMPVVKRLRLKLAEVTIGLNGPRERDEIVGCEVVFL